MKNILLMGATGTAGSAITKKLLSDTDYHLTLFARHAKNMYSDSHRVTVVNGDARKIDDLKKALRGQDVVGCFIPGYDLPLIAKNLVAVMDENGMKRLIFTGAVGIYNEIPDEIGGAYNVDNEPPQVPNRKAVDSIETSDLDYTILRPGFLRSGSEDDFVLTVKGEPAKGYATTIPSLVKLVVKIISDPTLYVRESVSITQNLAK